MTEQNKETQETSTTKKPGRPKGSKNKKPVGRPRLTEKQKRERQAQKEKEKEGKVDGRINSGTKRIVYEHTSGIPQDQLIELPIYAPLSIKQETYLQDQENDIVVWGGAASAGKTQLSLLRIMLCAMWDEHYVAGVARRSQKQMKAPGSLWSTGTKLFNQYNIRSNSLEMTWNFPSGAEVKCHHLDNNTDDWQGTQMTEVLVDESQQCQEDDVWYLTGRLRSKSKRKHQLRMTANPLSTSFLCKWLVKAGYVGEDGLPVKEMDGKTTFMLQQGGEFVWYGTRKEMVDAVGEATAKNALKFVFYSANVYDNPYVRKELPSYVHKLENLKEVERQKLLLGNWFAKEQGDGYIDAEWFNKVTLKEVPIGLPVIRCWDLASTKPHAGNKNPDYTRGVKCSYDRATGHFYILDVATMRDSAAMVEALIQKKADEDGQECYVGIPVDPGQAGKQVADQKRAKLLHKGIKVILNSTRGSKLQRAEPFLVALQNGRVFVVEGALTQKDYTELENFDGVKNNGQKDDLVDCLADCWSCLTGNKMVPVLKVGNGGHKYTKWNNGSTLLEG